MRPAIQPSASGVPRLTPVVLPENDRAAPWRALRVLNVAVQHPADGSSSWIIHGCVELGRLLPADVTVEATVEHDASVPAAHPRQPHRMWSEHPYGDGSFLFVTRVPGSVLQHARRVCMTVRPASTAAVHTEPAATACRDL